MCKNYEWNIKRIFLHWIYWVDVEEAERKERKKETQSSEVDYYGTVGCYHRTEHSSERDERNGNLKLGRQAATGKNVKQFEQHC